MAASEPRATQAMRPLSAPFEFEQDAPSEPRLRFVHVSDTHISHDPTYNLPEATHTPAEGARALVEAVNALPFEPDFVLHTGDVAYDPDPEAYYTARDIFQTLRFPVHYLNGNHDDPAALQRIMLGRNPPLKPLDFEFEVKGVQVVVVDSNGPAQQPAGYVTDAQLTRLEQIAKDRFDERPLVVATHHNVLRNGIPWWDEFMRMRNGEDFHMALLPARRRLRGVFHGHVHQPVDTYRDGILYSGTVSSWYQIQAFPGQKHTLADPNARPGFSVVTVTATQTFIRRHSFDV